jgi:hypothetical protein
MSEILNEFYTILAFRDSRESTVPYNLFRSTAVSSRLVVSRRVSIKPHKGNSRGILSISAAQGFEIPDPKSLIVRSSQISPPELQIHCKNEKSNGSYQSDRFREIGHEGLHVA